MNEIRPQFPILTTQVYGRPLVYLDNAATTQKPQRVIDALCRYYTTLNANIHRGAHRLAADATEAFELVRRKVQTYIGAESAEEIVFTRGTTESINLVAATFADRFLTDGDEIIVSGMEHHSDIVPWQLACRNKSVKLRVIPFSDDGQLDLEAYRALFTDRTKLVAVCHVSNTLGTINPVAEMAKEAHAHGAKILVDGAQAVAHIKVDVKQIGCDFYCFSGHKMYAPMGVGVMYGRKELLAELPPYQGGGEMIKDVSFERTTFNDLPFKFEAGTPSVADVVGLGEAIDFINETGLDRIAAIEDDLLRYATAAIDSVKGVKIYGTAPHKAAVLSFNVGKAHPYDVGTLLDKLGVAVRTGHHCTQPIMDRYSIPGTVRASFAAYNTREEVDLFIAALQRIAPMLS
ncbi:MAG: cysteine desulfurase [Bacteroidales bacterium]|nr:cysteine desulfurase [Bacteroidales bacterium]